MFKRELKIHKYYKNQTNQCNDKEIWKNKEGKEKRDITMDARRRSIIKNDAKKLFVTKASDNHASETHTTGVYILICFHTL